MMIRAAAATKTYRPGYIERSMNYEEGRDVTYRVEREIPCLQMPQCLLQWRLPMDRSSPLFQFLAVCDAEAEAVAEMQNTV
jgi:hypothetical protein